ncbi:MAG: AAA family ATPase, partial [Gammaproteobacteria bacterium]|nr:AAA family ATPase [Gammaproteobacteria bacterium]
AIQESIQRRVHEVTAPLEADLKKADMALVSVQSGPVAQTAIFPLVDGKPVQPDQFNQLVVEGKISSQRKEQVQADFPGFQSRLQVMSREVGAVYRTGSEQLHSANERAARRLLTEFTETIVNRFESLAVREFINEVVDDVVDSRLQGATDLPDPALRYGVNILVEHNSPDGCPIIEENTPSMINLLGTVEPEWASQGPINSDYRGIRAGSLLRADGGYLILDIQDMMAQPGAWRALMRTLRSGRLEIVPAEIGWMQPFRILKPEPIDISVRVILIGDAMSYRQLDAVDPDFSDLFKVLADVDSEVDRSETSILQYASVLSQIVRDETLLHFHRNAVAELVNHGARIAASAGKLTARFGRIADIAREASFLGRHEDAQYVSGAHVVSAIQRTKQRASLPSRKFQQWVHSGTIRVQTRGAVVGQVNGLAVISSGPVVYGFPARITATIGAGRAGLINIEGRASMSGSIHTKGFHILGGLLRYLLRTEHPLAFSASIAFEQSYGGIDGDSASGAEICCLLSALTGVPIRQSLAMTGAIDQHGHIQAIGGVNEKIEGFFDSCQYFGLTGDQAVIIPSANAGELMLRRDVVEACGRGEFCVYAVETIHAALEILTGMPAGNADAEGRYPDGTLLHAAVERAGEFWRRTLASPDQLVSVERDDANEN